MMVTNYFHRKRSLPGTVLVSVISAGVYNAAVHLTPALQEPLNISILSAFTDAQPNFRYYDFAVYGISAGGFLQTRHVVGVEVRGSLLK